MVTAGINTIPEHRDLTIEEHQLIVWLLNHGTKTRAHSRPNFPDCTLFRGVDAVARQLIWP